MKRFSFYICLVCLFTSVEAVTLESIKDIHGALDVPRYFLTRTINISDQESLYFFVIENYAKKGRLDLAIELIKTLPKDLKVAQKPLYIKAFLTYYNQYGTEDIRKYFSSLSTSNKPYVIERCILESIKKESQEDAELFLAEIEQSLIFSRAAVNVVKFLVSRDEIQKASEIVASIELQAQKDEAIMAMVKRFADYGDSEEVLNGIEMIVDTRFKEKSYRESGIIFAQNKAFNTALMLANKCESQLNYETVMGTLIQAFVDENRFDKAIEIAQTLTIESIKEKAWMILGLGFAKAGNFESVDRILSQMTDVKLRFEFILEASLELIRYNYIEEAYAYIQSLPEEKQLKPLVAMARELGGDKSFHYNLLLLQKTSNDELLNESLSWFAIGLADKGRTDKSMQVIDLILDEDIYRETIIYILTDIADLKDRETYKALLEDDILRSDYIIESLSKVEILSSEHISLIEGVLSNKETLDEDKFYLRLKLCDIYVTMGQSKDIDKQLKYCKRELMRLDVDVDSELFRHYLTLLIHQRQFSVALQMMGKYPDKQAQLLFFDLFEGVETEKDIKTLRKQLQVFAKRYKK
ncbi:hypothetical protein DID78_01705 [Candidatus Marinamargulisbacteria bacterium SCGC AG-343-D04]|nr:hypothetical protein DID78_01705 [Candidatus Marinamargulisbacteria bacterium SCGC AG-343-D04]